MNLAERLLWPNGVDPSRSLYTYAGETLTRAAVAEAVAAAAAGLRRIGVAADDRVVLMLYDTPALPILFLAVAATGAIPIAVNPMLRRATLTQILADSGAAVLIVERDHLQRVAEMNPLGGPALVVQDRYPASNHDSAPDLPHLTAWLAAGADGFDGFYSKSADSIAFWQYTSGTTGQPKAVCHTQQGMIASTALFAQGVLGIGPDDRIYSVPKMFFGYGQGNSLFFPLLTGATAYLDSRWPTPSLVVENIRAFRPTILFAVPTIYHQLLQGTAAAQAADLSSVRIAFSAGAPLKAPTFERWRSEFGVEILDGIGATEVGHVFLTNHPGRARSAKTGTPVAGYEAQLVDPAGRLVAASGEGVLLVSGPSVSPGYWQRPGETAAKFHDGSYRTGDRFRRDESGYYEYLGREDDQFKVHGRWVAPLEIENLVLAEHEEISEAAVVGIETATELCVPVLFVAAKTVDVTLAASLEERVLRGLAGRVEPYKLPRHCWVVAELPRNDNGKVVRARLAEQAIALVRDRVAVRTA